MNNRGFTLIEVISTFVIISLILIVVTRSFSYTVSLNKEESYKIMKNNIISASYNYINECTAGTISCDFSFNERFSFSAKVLKEKGYFKNLNSPIDGKNLEDRLIIEVKKENGVIISNLVDNCYQ